MKDFFNSKSAKILIATLAVLIVISILGATGNPWVSSAFNFFSKGLSSVTSKLTEEHKSYEQLQAENEKLRSEAADLRTQLVDYYDLKSENARLWKYYKLKKTHPDYELMPSSVIRRDTSEDFYGFTIDAGSSVGISKLDPVLTENGVIGFISSVSSATAKVTTILSPDFQAGAIDKKSGDSESRLIVFGSDRMFASTFMKLNSVNNAEFIMSIFNTLSEKEDESVTITGKSLDNAELGVTDLNTSNAMVIIFEVALPVLILITGIVVWLRRRNK